MCCRILEARDIGATNQYGQKKEGAKVDPYVKLKLGAFKKAPELKSKVQKNQRAAFSLGNEVLHFDIFEPTKYVSLSADGSGSEEIPLTVVRVVVMVFSLTCLSLSLSLSNYFEISQTQSLTLSSPLLLFFLLLSSSLLFSPLLSSSLLFFFFSFPKTPHNYSTGYLGFQSFCRRFVGRGDLVGVRFYGNGKRSKKI